MAFARLFGKSKKDPVVEHHDSEGDEGTKSLNLTTQKGSINFRFHCRRA